MLDDSAEARTCNVKNLDSTIQFKTYSDARLAELYLDDDLPFAVLERVLNVFFDPEFKMEDVTLKGGSKILSYVSECRRRNALKRTVAENPAPAEEQAGVVTRPSAVPPIVLDLVVDRLLDGRVPLGAAAAENEWEITFADNAADFHSMSLVHRSWTIIAQRGLRKRVVVPFGYIKDFLCSPFCGSAVREMIIYWSVDERFRSVTDSDLQLLDELLKRNPNVRSLAFNSAIAWPRCNIGKHPLKVGHCLSSIVQWLPNLENLWLRHFYHTAMYDDRIVRENHFDMLSTCLRIPALCALLPKMDSLRFLSITGWGGRGRLSRNAHPPSQLKAVELECFTDLDERALTWLLKAREGYRLESLYVSMARSYRYSEPTDALKNCMSTLKRLVIYLNDMIPPWLYSLLDECKELVDLEFLVMTSDPRQFHLPPSLERLSVHFLGSTDKHIPSTEILCVSGEKVVNLVKRNLARLPLLRNLHVTVTDVLGLCPPDRLGYQRLLIGDLHCLLLDRVVHFVNKHAEPVQGSLRDQLLDLCRDRNIELGR